ncbi:MAG: LysR family transcriptional regulator [Myxococcales bacterium]|nr:LysR family transcriptional regulator [Myxococcales bacterium]
MNRPHLNYQHLRYFWLTASEGTVTGAANKLRLSPSTISTQIKQLEEQLGHALFERKRRRLVLTERGKLVKAYADDIFTLGEELIDVVGSAVGGRHAYHMRVGVGFNLPKLLTYRLLAPAAHLPEFPVHLVIEEDDAERLVGHITTHHLDLVLSDQPVGLSADVRADCQPLVRTGISLFAAERLAKELAPGFPESLDGAPILLPGHGTAMRTEVEGWLAARRLHPRVMAEFGDSALLKAFGQEGMGVFPAPTLMSAEVQARYDVVELGELNGARETVYAVIASGKADNPAVKAVLDASRMLG